MQVFNCVDCKDACSSLNLLNICERIGLERTNQMYLLLIVVIFLKLIQIFPDLLSLYLDFFVYSLFNPLISNDNVSALHRDEVLNFSQKIVMLKLCPKLLAPFCEYPQNRRMFYGNLHVFDLPVSVFRYVFRNLSINGIRGISLNIIPISIFLQ